MPFSAARPSAERPKARAELRKCGAGRGLVQFVDRGGLQNFFKEAQQLTIHLARYLVGWNSTGKARPNLGLSLIDESILQDLLATGMEVDPFHCGPPLDLFAHFRRGKSHSPLQDAR